MTPGETTALLALMLAAALLGAGVSGRLRLPRIVGYILAGLGLELALIGLARLGVPAAGRLVAGSGSEVLVFIRRLALAAVLFSVGLAFELRHLRQLGKSFVRVALGQTLGALLLTFTVCLVVGQVAGADRPVIMAVFFAIAAVAVSPAATLLTVREYEAKGAATDDILAVTGLSAVVAIFLFDLALLVMGEAGCVPAAGGQGGAIAVAGRFLAVAGGSVLAGVAAGLVLALLHGRTSVNLETMALLAILLGVLAAPARLGLDYLIVSLLAGVTFINIAADPGRLEQRLATMAAPLFALLFVMAGFGLHLEAFAHPTTLALLAAYVIARGVGKIAGVRLALGRKRAGAIGSGISLGLLCHADVAIALVVAMGALWAAGGRPEWVDQLRVVIFGAVPLFELAGLLLLKRTVVAAGEVRAFRLFHFRSPVAGGWGSLHSAVASVLRRLGVLGLPKPHQGPIRARHVMHTNVKVLPAGATLDEVLHFIERSRLDHFPVVDAAGRFIGTINLADVRDMIYKPDLRNLVDAQDLLESDQVTATPDETLAELFDKLRAHKARDLVILDESSGQIQGIVEQRDVLRAMHVEQTGQRPAPEH